MKVVVITGSPHRAGTSALLADRFIEGVKEAGHEVFRFDTAFERIHPCVACDKCKDGLKSCIYQDGMTRLFPPLLAADLIVFATPLYYFGMSSQIKVAIDRFYSKNEELRGQKRKAVLMATAADSTEHVLRGLVGTYEEMCSYLHWDDCGKVLAYGCGTREDMEGTDYPEQAYHLGKMM